MGRIDRVEVRSVSRVFGATAALRGVRATLEGGAITVVEGPNGAGKSTLLAVLATVLRPSSGSVEYVPVGSRVELVRPLIGWVSHETLCYRELSARANVELAGKLYGVDPEVAWERVRGRVCLEGFAGRRVGTLSRGERQRVALARALVHEPAVLLLDETGSGLDDASGEALERVMCEERARGSVVVVVSHAVGLAARMGARSLSLREGRVVGG